MSRVSAGRRERCRKSWKSDAVVHPFSCMVATSISDIDGIIAEHAQLKRSFDTRKERKRQAGAIEASKQAVAARVITPINFYEKPPVLGEISQYECAYYKLDPKAFLQDKLEKEGGEWSIVVGVQASSGDPDLMISCSSKYPTDKDYTWRSMGEGDDQIVITPADPNYPHDGHGHWQPLFIAVPSVSAAACRFHIFASVSKWTDTESEKRRKAAAINMQSAVMSSVLASTERREKASKGRSYQEFLIDSAAPSKSSSFSIDRESSVGARRSKFAGVAKDLTLDKTTVCVDDPSSFTQRAMVATFESLTPNVVKRHEELQKIYSHYDPDVKVNIPDPTLANLGKGMCDADSSKEGEDAVRTIFKTTLMRPDSGLSIVSKPQKGQEEDNVAPSNHACSSAPHELLSGDRMPDIQWLFRRPPTPYTGVMQKVLESGYGTKHSMRRMLEAFQSVDADKVSHSPPQTPQHIDSQKPFKIITFRGLPLPPPPQSRANLKRLLTIIQSDWDLRRKGGVMKGEEGGMVPVVPIPRKPSVALKHRDRVALAEAAASGTLKITLASLGLAMSSQGALVRAGTEIELAADGDADFEFCNSAASEKDTLRVNTSHTTSLSGPHDADEAAKSVSREQLPPHDTMSSHVSMLVPGDTVATPDNRAGKGYFKTIGRRPNSDFACVSRPLSALAKLGSGHKDVQKLPHRVKSGAMPPRAPPCPEEDTAIYWQSFHEKLLKPNRSKDLATELRPAPNSPGSLLSRPSSVTCMRTQAPLKDAAPNLLSASTTRPSSSLSLQRESVDLTKGVSFHMMHPATEALIQQATDKVDSSKHMAVGAAPAISSSMWIPTLSHFGTSRCKIPGMHAKSKKNGQEKLQIAQPSVLPQQNPSRPHLPFDKMGDLLYSSPLNSPVAKLSSRSECQPAV